MHGAKVINEKLEGLHWVRQHNMVKAEIKSLCPFAGLPAECEAYGCSPDWCLSSLSIAWRGTAPSRCYDPISSSK